MATAPVDSHGSSSTKSVTRDLPLLALAGAITASGIAWFLQRPESDFQMFYESGRAWLSGAPPYRDVNNLSPPTGVVSLFALMAFLPYDLAKLVWTLGGALALAASSRAIQSELRLSAAQTARMIGTLGITYAAWGVWFQGQLLWILLYPCTRSWIALRRERMVAAGLWLAPIVVLKPQFALLALVLPWRVIFVSGAASLAISTAAVLLTGWQLWADWIAAGNRVYWLSWADNASLWGAASRVQSGVLRGTRLADLPVWLPASIVAATVAVGFLVRRTPNMDRRFTLAVLWTVLFSPLGWVHYLPLCLGPATASWPDGRTALLALLLIAVPLPILLPWLDSPLSVAILGNIYSVAVVIGFCAWGRSRPA